MTGTVKNSSELAWLVQSRIHQN